MLNGKKALVTGSNGFVGSFLTERLLKEGMEVYCLVRKTSNLRWIKDLKVKFVYGDISDKDSLGGLFKNIDYVFHTAGLKKGWTKEDFLDVNYIGTKNLVEIIYKENPNIKKFVYISSLAVMGPSLDGKSINESNECKPVTYYGESKLRGEEAVLEFSKKIPVTIIRPPAIYGPRDEDIYSMFKAVKLKIKPIFGFKKRHISLCYVKDLIEGVILSTKTDKSNGRIYIIADDKIYAWKEILDEMAKTLEVKAFTIKIPVSVIFTSAYLSELVASVLNTSTIFTRQKVKEMIGDWPGDISKARNELGFVPEYDLHTGISETIKWYKENKWL
ncbi:MAG: NAD-dependent epimerase/dehydratase family protein [Candidatus Firestonebacteria bacterium]